MKKILAVGLACSLAAGAAFGQAGVGIRERAKELSRQNNVRQGVATPAPPAPQHPPPAPPPPSGVNVPKPAATAQESIASLQAAIGVFKSGTPVTADQKQQLLKSVALAMRGKKATLATVQKSVDTLSAALGDSVLDAAQQKRLATDLDSVANSTGLPADQFDAIIADVQAVLQVGQVKRNAAVAAAADLKAVGAEIRR